MVANAVPASPEAAGGGGPSTPNPSSVSAGLAAPASGVAEMPAESATRRRIMSGNRPESGRLDQSALAVTWNSTTRPDPRGASVTSGVPSASRAQVWVASCAEGSASTWRLTRDLVRHGQAGEGRGGGERRQLGRLAPGQRAAQLTVLGEQPFGQQGSATGWPNSSVVSALRGPAKRSSRPPSSTQRCNSATSDGVTGRSARTIDGDLALQQGVQVAVAQLGERFERLVQVVERADQRRVRAGLRGHAARPGGGAGLRPAGACRRPRRDPPARAG